MSDEWVVIGMTAVIVAWSFVVIHRWGAAVRRYVADQAARGLARAVLLLAGLYAVALALTWSAAFLALDETSGRPADLLLAGVILLAVVPWFVMATPTRSGMPFYDDLRAEGVPPRTATTLAWVAAPFAFLGLLGVIVTVIATYITVFR